jgi:acyl-CoA synthetase (AMP-forming)/AMP-acid ligase II
VPAATIRELLDRGAAGAVALKVPDGPSLTYARLRDLVDETAARLTTHGVQPHDRVAIVYPNGAEAVVLFLASSMIAVACPLNAAYKEDEFRFYLEDTGARFLLVPPEQGAGARRALPH